MRTWGLELAAGCCWLGAGGGGGLGLGCCAGHAGGGGAGGGPRLAPKGQSGQANAAPALALRRQVGGLAEVIDSRTQARHLGSAVQAAQQASGVRISASVRYACAPRSVSGAQPQGGPSGVGDHMRTLPRKPTCRCTVIAQDGAAPPSPAAPPAASSSSSGRHIPTSLPSTHPAAAWLVGF